MPTPEETARQIEAIKRIQNAPIDGTRGNALYLAVLPLVHMSNGLTEQTLTLFPDRKFATEFMPDEVESYHEFFMRRAKEYMVGGRVLTYGSSTETTESGRVIVKVVQIVK